MTRYMFDFFIPAEFQPTGTRSTAGHHDSCAIANTSCTLCKMADTSAES